MLAKNALHSPSTTYVDVHVRCLNVMSAGLTGILAAFIFSKPYSELCTYLLYPIFLSLGLLHICRFFMNIFLSLFGCFVSCLSNWGCWVGVNKQFFFFSLLFYSFMLVFLPIILLSSPQLFSKND